MFRGASVLCLLWVILGCREESPRPPVPVAKHPDGYVDDLSCKDCHEQVYAGFMQTGMGQSFYRPDPDRVIETLGKPYRQASTGRFYEMFWRDGALWQRRYLQDSKGNRFAEFAVKVDYIVGSGNHVRSYLTQTRHGELYQLPLSWYAGVGWRMSPGYELEHHRFERRVSRACMFCHNAYPKEIRRPQTFPAQLPHGIGCQRCHGPGGKHVAVARDEDATKAQIKASIQNPADFSLQRREDLCLSCHLQPEAQGDFLPRRFGQPVYGFRPGDDLSQHIVHLDHGSKAQRAERLQINHHGYRLRQSACYVGSRQRAGLAMECVTCHDPHRKPSAAERVAFYRQACVKCHKIGECSGMGEVDADQADCAGCHMPKARPMDVVHATITDHRIRKVVESELTAERQEKGGDGTPLQVLPYFAKRAPQDANLWRAYAGFGEASGTVAADKLRSWRQAFLASAPKSVQDYVQVGRKLLAHDDAAGAEILFREALKRHPQAAAAHLGLGDALWARGDATAALPFLRTALQRLPGPDAHRSMADALASLRRFEEAKEHYLRSLKLRDLSWRSWRHYAHCCEQLQDPATARSAYRRAVALNPGDGFAFRRLAALLGRSGQHAKQLTLLRQAREYLPLLGLDLIEALCVGVAPALRDPAQALQVAETLARHRPRHGRVLLHLAMAEALAGKPSSALGTVHRAVRHGADPASAAAVRGLALMRQNKIARARQALANCEQALQRADPEPLRRRLPQLLRQAVR